MDRTEDLETCNERIQSPKLIYIADVCNQFILLNVLCLWGCSEFIHKTGYIDMDTIIQKFIQ